MLSSRFEECRHVVSPAPLLAQLLDAPGQPGALVEIRPVELPRDPHRRSMR